MKQTIILDSIGGQGERAWVGGVCCAIKATHYKFPPCVMEYEDDKDIRREEILRLGGRLDLRNSP